MSSYLPNFIHKEGEHPGHENDVGHRYDWVEVKEDDVRVQAQKPQVPKLKNTVKIKFVDLD